jgi:hypothetical protein
MVEFGGRNLTISIAKPLAPRPPRRPFQHGQLDASKSDLWQTRLPDEAAGSSEQARKWEVDERTIYVGGLPYSMVESEVEDLFSSYGKPEHVWIAMDKMTGRSRGFGFTWTESPAAAQAAVSALNAPPELPLSPAEILRRCISRAFAELVAQDPTHLRTIEWRELEHMLRGIFDGLGFDTTLTESLKDGGKDLILRFTIHGREHDYFVEVKHWRSGKRVGEKPVRTFIDVVFRERARGGLFLSSSGFAEATLRWITGVERHGVRLGGEDKIVTLCRTYLQMPSGVWARQSHLEDLLFIGTV